MKYKYHLLKYRSGTPCRFTCPQCGRARCFSPYVDDDDHPVDVQIYGRCDHQNSCGYHAYPPSESHWAEHSMMLYRNSTKDLDFKLSSSAAVLCTIPDEFVTLSTSPEKVRSNPFVKFLLSILPEEDVLQVIELYRIGTSKSGGTVFFQFDIQGRCRSGKIIHYNSETGHRIKDGSKPGIQWVHSLLIKSGKLPSDWSLNQCLLGEHLLAEFPDKPIALVEAEKTAVICSAIYTDFIWLATGSSQQFNDRLLVLEGRKIIAFPDIDAHELWLQKSLSYPSLHITISNLLAANATPEQREAKIDIADLVVEELKKKRDKSP